VVCNDFLTDPRLALWRDRARERNYRSVSAFPIRVGSDTIGALAIYAAEKDFFDTESVALLDRLAANLSFALERIAADEMRQRAVKELDQFFVLSLDMLCIADLRGYIYRLNPAWEQTLGFSAAEMCSRPCVEFIHPADREQALAAAATLAEGETVHRMELRFVSKDGSYRWLTGSAAPSAEHGVVFAAVSDITELKRLDEQLHSQNLALQEQNHRLNEASRMKSEFLANMSHELRSPLNGIIGFTELLQDGKLGAIPEKPRGYLGRIHKSAQHLLELINSVLDVSKIEAGRMELYPEPVHLPSLVEEVIAIQGALAAQKTLRIETDLQPEADRVVTDAARFKQILHNYLSNALKFTNPGGRVTVRLQPEGSAEFRLEVSDTGVGIAATDIPRLFTEFQQLDLTASKRYQGTGLGLALTKRIVEAQGGRVGVRSQPGEGSTFFAVLPKGRTASDSQPTVLLVEDERAQSSALVRRLQESGLAVEIASTTAAAVAKCRQKRFDAIILELLLPDESGYEPLAAIRSLESHRQTPVVVVSAVGPPASAESRDIQGFLTKPVDPGELAACLERCGLLREPKEAA
jgi:PAS domain S-box-containing protein